MAIIITIIIVITLNSQTVKYEWTDANGSKWQEEKGGGGMRFTIAAEQLLYAHSRQNGRNRLHCCCIIYCLFKFN